MNVEERIGRSLEQGLNRLDAGSGDLAAVTELGGRIRRRRRAGAVLSAAAVVAVVAAGVTVLGDGGDDNVEPAPPVGGSWQELAPMPLSPRWMPVTAWTGTEVLVIGGGIDTPCPPSASCTDPDRMGRDGAAYDPDTDTWRPIADAPVAVGYWYRPAFVAGELVLFGDDEWWAYDPEADAWHDLPEPAHRVSDTGDLATSEDGFVYVLSRKGDLWALNVEREHWAKVPLGSPDGFERSTVVLAGDTFAFSGVREADPDGPNVVDVGGPDRLVDTGQTNPFRHWTGRRLVELDLQVTPDGTPYGGRLDPVTREWTPLPDAPSLEADRGDGWSLVANDGPLMAGWGYAYDDDTGTWTTLGKPEGTPVDDSQSAVWVDGRLMVVAGVDDETGYEDVDGLSNQAWAWIP